MRKRTGRQKRNVAGLRFFLGKTRILDNAVAAEKIESRTKWGFLEVPISKMLNIDVEILSA